MHHEVENNKVGSVLPLENIEGFLAIKCKRNPEWALLQLDLDDAADMRFVVGNQDVSLLL